MSDENQVPEVVAEVPAPEPEATEAILGFCWASGSVASNT